MGFITNHSYLDNPTFRGMRQSLMKSFNEIYILDLHGNSLKKEKCPDGSKDENVFDIRQGVAIALFVKKQGKKGCKVYHSERWGLRDRKYGWLNKNDIQKTEWKRLSPKSESYFFIPRDERFLEKYENYPKITEIFPLNGVGMTTARDRFVIDTEKNTLRNRIRRFKNSKYSDDELHNFFQIRKKKGWDIRKAWGALQSISDSEIEKFILPVLYRPFDVQSIFWHDAVVWRTVKRVMHNVMKENMTLCVGRAGQVVGLEKPWNIVFCTTCIADFNLFYRGGNVNFPLYLYPKKDNPQKRSSVTALMLFEPPEEYASKTPNLSPEIVKQLRKNFGEKPTPEEIFFYVYAILYANTYRIKYSEFLRSDFPRIPFTKNPDLFSNMAEYGERLVQLHLLESSDLNPPIAKFRRKGEGAVEELKYDGSEKRVYFNQGQYFEGISNEMWEYQIGGYQVCHKWLKDRKGRTLSTDDIKHYCRIATAIQKTIEIQKEIDRIYPEVEIDTIEFYQ